MRDEGVETLRAQVRWLSNVVAAAMVLMFAVVALPWLIRMIDVDLAPLAWTLTLFAVAHAALQLGADRIESRAVLARLLHAVPLFGAGFMAVLWHHGGGVGHPALALAMVLPVIGAAALPRPRFTLDVALYSIIIVTVAVAIASPDFGWYVTQLGIPGAGLLRAAGQDLPARDPFPGATTTPAAMFLFVATFAAIQLAAAFVAARVARFVRSREDLAIRLQDEGDLTLPAAAIRTTPVAAVVVVAATGQIVQATKRFTQRMLLHNEAIVGRELFGILRFYDPAAVRTLLVRGGAIPFCRYHVGAEERVAEVVAESFEHDGVAYANVVVTDRDDAEGA